MGMALRETLLSWVDDVNVDDVDEVSDDEVKRTRDGCEGFDA